MTGRPNPDAEALRAALAEHARDNAPAPAPEPDPEELLDYLAGRLGPEDARRIERRAVADPETARALLDLAEFEAAERAADEAAEGAEGAEGMGAAAPAADLAVHAGWRDLRNRLGAERPPARRTRPAPWLVAAALGVLAVGLGHRASRLEEQLGRPVAVAASLDLHSGGRSAAPPAEVAVAEGAWLELAIDPPERCDRYDAALEGPGAGERLAVGDLRWSAPGLVKLALPAAPGDYRLVLSGCEPRRELDEYRFRVTPPPPAGAGDGG